MRVPRLEGVLLVLGFASLFVPGIASSQERGAAAFGELVSGLGTTARVLVIGAHPDDEDTRLIAWLQRGRQVETAYLSLTRGDGGQNLIGNELGEALGVIRTEELLAARRIDGARQYFTRAYDFGFSKSAEETFRHWPRDSLLGDAVKVVRAFRPHVIVSVFSGTPRDGHGQHQVAGILARDAYDVAGDSARFPPSKFGEPWLPLKFYRSTSFRGEGATLTYNAGEYSPLLGRSYAEIAGESRSQHKSQAFGVLQRRGVSIGSARREASRVNDATDPKSEKSIFDGIDTTLPRLKPATRCAGSRTAFDSIAPSIALAQRSLDLLHPYRVAAPLAAVLRVARKALADARSGSCRADPDVITSLAMIESRAADALLLALGVAVEATARRSAVIGSAYGTLPVTVTVYNRGEHSVSIPPPILGASGDRTSPLSRLVIQPDSSLQFVERVPVRTILQPWWLAMPRDRDMFTPAIPAWPASVDTAALGVELLVEYDGTAIPVQVPVVNRFADPVRGEVQRPVAVVPAISVTLGQQIELVAAGAPIDRQLSVQLRSADTSSRDVTVRVHLPAGLSADSLSRTAKLAGFGSTASVGFRIRGRLPAGRHTVRAAAESNGQTFSIGYVPIEYDHITPQKLYRQATLILESVDVKLPRRLNVAYIPGVGDNIAPVLRQLGVPLTVLEPASLSVAALALYTAIVVGPRAYEASDALVASNGRLLDYVKNGGRLVVQYGQYEMAHPGIMPYPITINRPHDRVTDESSPVRVLDASHAVVTTPNRITDGDFAGWVQERSLYMPRTFAAEYTPVLSVNDPGEEPNNGSILVAPSGKGTYVYTTLAFFRQLPAGVPGATRLFVNLLGADASPGASPKVRP